MLPHLADWTACVRWRLQSFRRKREWAAGAPSTVATPSLAWHHPRSSADSIACRLQPSSCAGVSARAHSVLAGVQAKKPQEGPWTTFASFREVLRVHSPWISHRPDSRSGVFEDELRDSVRHCNSPCPDAVNQQHHGRLDKLHRQVHRCFPVIEKRAHKVLLNPGVLDSDSMLKACFPAFFRRGSQGVLQVSCLGGGNDRCWWVRARTLAFQLIPRKPKTASLASKNASGTKPPKV